MRPAIKKLISIITALLLIAAAGIFVPLFAADSETRPFQSVVLRNGEIVAKLPAAGARYHVDDGSSKQRLSTHGESFTLKPGSSLRLVERHSTFQITAQLSPKAGLRVESTIDARSFGDGIKKESYFVEAR